MNDDIKKEMCDLFKNGTCIPELMKKYGFGRNKITKLLKEGLGDEYKYFAKKISIERWRLGAKKYQEKGIKIPRTPEWSKKIGESQKGKKLSDETKAKISESGRTRLERGTLTIEKIKESRKKAAETAIKNGSYEKHSVRHSEWMKRNCPNRGKKTAEETKKKQRDSKRKFYENGGVNSRKGIPHSKETLIKISEATSQMWKNGKFGYGNNGLFRSKLETSIFEEFLKIFPKTVHSYPIVDQRTYVYDIYVPELQLIVEVNGDYWHLNPSLYDENFVDNSRNVSSVVIWENDKKKIETAVKLGYKTAVIWESDIKSFGVESIIKSILSNQ